MSWHNEFRYLFALQTILHKPRRPGDGFPEDINGKRFVIDGNVLRNKGLPYGGIVCVQEIRNEYIAMPVLSAKSYEGDWLGISQIADLLSLGFIVGVDVVIPGDDHFPRERQKEIKWQLDRIRKIILDGEEVLKEKKKMQGLAKSSTSIEERRRLTEQARNLEEEYRNNRDDEEELDQQIMVAISEGNKLRVVAWCAWIARESLSSNSD